MIRRCTVLLALLGCEPTFDRLPTLVDGPTVLAIRAEPPEAPPGELVTLRAALANGEGLLAGARVDWAFCTQPRSVAENTPVAQACLEATAPWILPIASAAGETVDAMLPSDGCANFGSEPPPPPPGEDPIRPADPDATGGYYQPVRVTLVDEGLVAFGRVRLRCALPSAPVDVVREYRERYASNRNPELRDLAVVGASSSEVRLRTTWSEEDAEKFVVHDSRASDLVDAEEVLRVSWLSTAGRFAADRTGPEGGSPEAGNTLFTPSATGVVHVWAVLRDSRGGVSWRSLEVDR